VTAALTLDEFKLRTVMPSGYVDELVMSEGPNFWPAQFAAAQEWIDARLAKRYALPFAAPVPGVYLGWITVFATLAGYQRRGWDPSAKQNELVVKAVDDAKKEISEAADSAGGLFELPLRADTPGASGVAVGGPLGYAEASPYDWTDRQIEAVRGF
jgi:hypothetical protein